jgi:thiol-disulfide isomerase/thioredoxin
MKCLLVFVFVLFTSCLATAQPIPAMSIDEVIKRTSSRDTTYIINFWATWCAPCVEELPVFNKLQKRYADKPIKVLLVSLDFKQDYPLKLNTFLQRKSVLPDVIWLSDTNPNVFVPKIDNTWEGSIPATVVVRPATGDKIFIEGQVTEKQITGIIERMKE